MERLKTTVLVIFAVGIGLLEIGLKSAVAQELLVRLELTAPVDHPGAIISNAVFSNDAGVVGEFDGILAVSGGSAAGSIPVSEEPNTVILDFRVPFGGILTSYSIPMEDFSFGQDYFLPNPSPGGTIGPVLSGDREEDAFFVLSLLEVSDDRQAPLCDITPGDGVIEAVIQDADSGLAEIEVASTRNVTVEVPEFEPDDSVIVKAFVIDPTRTAVLALKAIDEAGNSSYCKHVQKRTRRSFRHFRRYSH